jgi:ElaB/YqjD/DUF883 family membrane-anchored ribosome-binding protein
VFERTDPLLFSLYDEFMQVQLLRSDVMVSNNEKLVKDVKAVVADAEAMLRETTGKTSKELAELRASMSERLDAAKARLIEAEEAMVDKAKEAAKVTDEYVHENPWKSAIIAGGVGFLIGYLSSSHRH